MEALAGRQRLLGLGQSGEQLLLVVIDERLPDRAGRLALEPREVREQAPDGRAAMRRDIEVLLEPVVEVEGALVAELQDRDRREGLGDRADAVGVVDGGGRRLGAARRLAIRGGRCRDPHRGAPHHVAPVHDRGDHARRAPLRLRDADEPLERGGRYLTGACAAAPVRAAVPACPALRHVGPAPPASARRPGRCRRPRCRGESRRAAPSAGSSPSARRRQPPADGSLRPR